MFGGKFSPAQMTFNLGGKEKEKVRRARRIKERGRGGIEKREKKKNQSARRRDNFQQKPTIFTKMSFGGLGIELPSFMSPFFHLQNKKKSRKKGEKKENPREEREVENDKQRKVEKTERADNITIFGQ